MSTTSEAESREGVPLTNLDQPLFDGAGARKRDLVEYLDGVRDGILPVLEDRPLRPCDSRRRHRVTEIRLCEVD